MFDESEPILKELSFPSSELQLHIYCASVKNSTIMRVDNIIIGPRKVISHRDYNRVVWSYSSAILVYTIASIIARIAQSTS